MPTPPDSQNPPQTAAELLEGLLRSQLFAESLFGQVFEQSRPYLDRPAGEYAAALVEKRVLTQWLAEELLAGRVGLYAGKFRLLERLSRTEDAQWFVAEQAGAQRLVLLQVSRSGLVGDSTSRDRSAGGIPQRGVTRHRNVAHCVVSQQTPQLRLVAYEFLEAKPLTELLETNPIERRHSANLVQQFVAALSVLPEEIMATVGLRSVWIDSQGQLKLLAGLNPLTSDQVSNPRSPQCETLQFASVIRFATALGGLPELARCQSVEEVVHCLAEIAEPWTTPFAVASLRCQRARMNRHLRRGPALRLIESFGEDLQFDVEGPGEDLLRDSKRETGHPPTQSEAEMPPKSPPQPGRSRRRAWAVSAVLLLIVAVAIVTQWMQRVGVRPAEATTMEEVENSSDTSH
jgi:hypothetical protein